LGRIVVCGPMTAWALASSSLDVQATAMRSWTSLGGRILYCRGSGSACTPLLRAGAGAGRPASCCWWTRDGAREDRRPSRVVVVPCLPRNQRPRSVLQGENTCIDHLERLFCMPRLVAGLLARCRAFGAASSSIHQDKFRTSFLLLVTLDLSDTTLVLFSALHASCMPAGRGTG